MQDLSPRYILTRAITIIALVIAAILSYSFIKKQQRKAAITTELQSITSDSVFFKQFNALDAHKALIRAIGLIAEANTLGVPPNLAIDRGLGIKQTFFKSDDPADEPTIRDSIIRTALRTNYENFLKLGYKPDFQTIGTLKTGELPPIPGTGRRPAITPLISPTISPGMEKVIANLEIRPTQTENPKPTDIEVAAAKQLARDMASAKIIEDPVRDRIIEALTPAPPEKP